jgi:AcrR family transcriptional regulator
MAEIDTTRDKTQDKRCRGRPQVRPDDETRGVIYEAARHEFAARGYAATSMETVARRAGVSTKTLYRLIPNKASLFEGMVSDRLDRFLSVVNLHAADHTDIEQALFAALMACADLALDEEVIALQRMVLQEAGKFCDIAGTFYKNAIQRTAAALADWLRVQQARGLIALATSTRPPACCSAWLARRHGARHCSAACRCRHARRSKRGCAIAWRCSCGVARCRAFVAADADHF